MNLVDVIIPTYKPDNKFLVSIKRLLAQTVAPGKIIIINTDNATAKDVKELISYVQKVVKEKSGVKLYPEVKML